MDPNSLKPIILQEGPVQLYIVPFGAHLQKLIVQSTHDLLVGPEDATEYAQIRGFRNCLVGRYANRLPSSFSFGRSNTRISLSTEDDVVLHSGKDGYDQRVWNRLERSESALFTLEDPIYRPQPQEVVLYIDSPDGDQGFPGAIHIEALYSLSILKGIPTVLVAYRAVLLSGTATVINLTQHTGYIIKPDENIGKHRLWLKSDTVADLDPITSLASGSTKSVKRSDLGKPMDLTKEDTPLSDYLEQGLDDNYHFANHSDSDILAILSHPESSIQLSFRSNQSSVMVYTANGFDSEEGSKKSFHASDDKKGYNKHGCIFLEFHEPVGDVVHNKNSKTILYPNQVYEAWHSISIKGI